MKIWRVLFLPVLVLITLHAKHLEEDIPESESVDKTLSLIVGEVAHFEGGIEVDIKVIGTGMGDSDAAGSEKLLPSSGDSTIAQQDSIHVDTDFVAVADVSGSVHSIQTSIHHEAKEDVEVGSLVGPSLSLSARIESEQSTVHANHLPVSSTNLDGDTRSTELGGVELGSEDRAATVGGVELGSEDRSAELGGVELGSEDRAAEGGVELGSEDRAAEGGVELRSEDRAAEGGVELGSEDRAAEGGVELGSEDRAATVGGVELGSEYGTAPSVEDLVNSGYNGGTDNDDSNVSYSEDAPPTVASIDAGDGTSTTQDSLPVLLSAALDPNDADEIVSHEKKDHIPDIPSDSIGTGDDNGGDDEVDEEEDVMKEMLEIQRREEEEHHREAELMLADAEIAAEAERAAKEAEAAEKRMAAEAEALRRKEEAAKAAKAAEDADWIKRSRPGADARPGSGLKQAKTSSSASSSSAASSSSSSSAGGSRDRTPESLRGSSGAARGSGGSGAGAAAAAGAGPPNAGTGYFGGGAAASQTAAEDERQTEQQQQQRRRQPTQTQTQTHQKSSSPNKQDHHTDKLSTAAGNRVRDLESKLNPQMRAKMVADRKKKSEEEQVRLHWEERAAVPRKYARPVERVIAMNEDSQADLYDVLGIKCSADEGTIKRAYRHLALVVHPDKNPHPDAKIAFDAIQDAFVTLSTAAARNEYDRKVRMKAGSGRFDFRTIQRLVKKSKSELYNLKSRLQLFWVRVFKKGELGLEYEELIGERVRGVRAGFTRFVRHIVLLPSVVDRLSLVTEVSYDSRGLLFWGSVLIAHFIPFPIPTVLTKSFYL